MQWSARFNFEATNTLFSCRVGRERGLGHISEAKEGERKRQSVVYKLYPFQIEMRVKMQLTWSLGQPTVPSGLGPGKVKVPMLGVLLWPPLRNCLFITSTLSCARTTSLSLPLPLYLWPFLPLFLFALQFFYSLCAHKNRKWLWTPGTHSTLDQQPQATRQRRAQAGRSSSQGPDTSPGAVTMSTMTACLADSLPDWPKCWWHFLHTQPIKYHWTQVSLATGKVSRPIWRFSCHLNKTFYADTPQLQSS